MDINDKGDWPFFPDYPNRTSHVQATLGISLREYAAIQIMAASLSSVTHWPHTSRDTASLAAKSAVHCADALMKELALQEDKRNEERCQALEEFQKG